MLTLRFVFAERIKPDGKGEGRVCRKWFYSGLSGKSRRDLSNRGNSVVAVDFHTVQIVKRNKNVRCFELNWREKSKFRWACRRCCVRARFSLSQFDFFLKKIKNNFLDTFPCWLRALKSKRLAFQHGRQVFFAGRLLALVLRFVGVLLVRSVLAVFCTHWKTRKRHH